MSIFKYESTAQPGDLAQLVSVKHKYFLLRLETDQVLQTHRGVIQHNDMIGQPWGTEIHSHLGSRFHLMIPALSDLITDTQRNSQILYPKDIGFILLTMGVGPGKRVLEAGTGSGGLTTALAYNVGETGQVYSYEIRDDMQTLAKKNLQKLGLADRVEFKVRDIAEGFDETDTDVLFLDVQNPFDYLPQVRKALKPGGFFGSLLPTTNQVTKLVYELERNDFAFIDVCEILLRYYRATADRFRPADRMVAHTGYLIFARPIIRDTLNDSDSEMDEEDESTRD